jgi:integral membrane protein
VPPDDDPSRPLRDTVRWPSRSPFQRRARAEGIDRDLAQRYVTPERPFDRLRGVYSLKTFRIIALTEATSFLMLLVASVLKRTADAEIGVTILGPIHGILFVAYVLIALGVRPEQGWSPKTTLLILLGAVVPFGGYVVDRWLTRQEPSPSRA